MRTFRQLFIKSENLPRLIAFSVAALAHILLLLFLIFDIEIAQIIPDPPVTVMKLADIQEYAPPPPPPPPPPVVPAAAPSTVEAIAEEMIEVDELEPEAAVTVAAAPAESIRGTGNTGPDYLPQSRISVLPIFDLNELKIRTVYPPIARRSGIEGNVILELFIDKEGVVRNIAVLRETPEGRGFAEAAVKAFQGMRAIPGQANGEDVGVRYRWPVRFSLK
jgi:protein TonB